MQHQHPQGERHARVPDELIGQLALVMNDAFRPDW
jgi:hypothetical protein